ncbi:putative TRANSCRIPTIONAL REGULATORY domain protein [Mycobacterium tuberculosis variant bovis]|nr:putative TRANSCRIPTIONAL REGULATORY domain protein [Mycobacterium tuberculosis variant bovis]
MTMTISFSSSNLRDDATSGNGDYRLDKLPETTPSTSVFESLITSELRTKVLQQPGQE